MCYGIYSMDGKMQVGLMTAFVIKRFAVREAAGIFPVQRRFARAFRAHLAGLTAAPFEHARVTRKDDPWITNARN